MSTGEYLNPIDIHVRKQLVRHGGNLRLLRMRERERGGQTSWTYGRHCSPSKDYTSGSFHKFPKVTRGVQLLVLDLYPIF